MLQETTGALTVTSMPLHWDSTVAALAADESVTHTLDFGPAKGVAPFTKKCLEARGVLEKRNIESLLVGRREGFRTMTATD